MVDFLPERHVEDSRILITSASERQRMRHFGYDYTNHHEAERSITCGSQFISDLSFGGYGCRRSMLMYAEPAVRVRRSALKFPSPRLLIFSNFFVLSCRKVTFAEEGLTF